MKRLLFLVPKLPLPLNSGFHIRAFNLLKLLSYRFRIALVCFGHLPDENYKVDALRELCDEVVVVEEPNKDFLRIKSKIPYISGLNYRLRSLKPEMAHIKFSSQMTEVIEQKLKDPFDFFWVERIFMGSYLQAGLPLNRSILDVDDIETIRYRRMLRYTKWSKKKVKDSFEYIKMIFYQRKILRKLGHIVVCSEHDKQILTKETPAHIYIVPNGVNTEYFRSQNEDIEQNCLVFVGAMNHEPNVDGMEYFLKEVFGRIKDRIPTAKLYIVGKNPPEDISKYNDDKNVIVTGEVEDIRTYYNLASIAVVPLRFAGGTRIKILEALSMGKAVVSTSVGCEGLDLEAEKDLIIADGAQEMARRCVELLLDVQKRKALGLNGRRLVEKKYDWQRIGEFLDDIFRKIK